MCLEMLSIKNGEKCYIDLYYNDLFALQRTISEAKDFSEITKKCGGGPEIVLP